MIAISPLRNSSFGSSMLYIILFENTFPGSKAKHLQLHK